MIQKVNKILGLIVKKQKKLFLMVMMKKILDIMGKEMGKEAKFQYLIKIEIEMEMENITVKSVLNCLLYNNRRKKF